MPDTCTCPTGIMDHRVWCPVRKARDSEGPTMKHERCHGFAGECSRIVMQDGLCPGCYAAAHPETTMKHETTNETPEHGSQHGA